MSRQPSNKFSGRSTMKQVIDDHYAMITLQEAAVLWVYAYQSINQRIQNGEIYARKSAGTWLVATDDLLAVYGMPPKPKTVDLQLTWHHVKRRMNTCCVVGS